MRVLPHLLLCLLAGVGCVRATTGDAPQAAVATVSTPRPAATDSTPPTGWILRGDAPQDYVSGVDREIRRRGTASGHLRARVPEPGSFGTLMQAFQSDSFLGRRVRLSAYLRTREARRAQLWMRVDGPGMILDFDNMDERPVVGTTDWAQHSIVLDVRPESIGIAFGVFLDGRGELWIDDVAFEVVGYETPRTVPWAGIDVTGGEAEARETIERYAKRPAGPRNLAFEEP